MERNSGLRERRTQKETKVGSRALALLLGLSLAGSLAACGTKGESTAEAGSTETTQTPSAADPVTKQSYYFDTVCQITVYDMDDMTQENAEMAIQAAFEKCAYYEKLLTKTKEGSDIWNVNHAEGAPTECDPETISIIEKGISYGDLTDGKFDITIGTCEDLWDFHSDDPKVPDADALAEAVKHVDYKNIEVDGNTVTMKDPDCEIDLGGIAKGYIADRTAEVLRDQGVTSAIISLGGNIECVGAKPQDAGGTRPFTIGIETPYSDMTKIVGTVQITNGTAVTSGVYERYFTVDGKEYHHILDPKTGYPVDTDTLGVTIIGAEGTSADCDALSTSCLILGSEKGKELIESLDGYEAAFILRDDSIVETSGMNLTEMKS